jgi:hypothetical protein
MWPLFVTLKITADSNSSNRPPVEIKPRFFFAFPVFVSRGHFFPVHPFSHFNLLFARNQSFFAIDQSPFWQTRLREILWRRHVCPTVCPNVVCPTIVCPTVNCLTVICLTVVCETVVCPTVDCLTVVCLTGVCPTVLCPIVICPAANCLFV